VFFHYNFFNELFYCKFIIIFASLENQIADVAIWFSKLAKIAIFGVFIITFFMSCFIASLL